MSLKLLIATAKPKNVKAFCDEHGISRSWFYEIRSKYEAEGEAGLELRSRAAHTIANKTPVWVEDEIVRVRKELADEGLDAGPETIHWHLSQVLGEVLPSASTIWRILKDRGMVASDPSKRPNKTWKRFEADRANDLFQIDGTGYELADGTVVKIVNIIDDGSRYCPASQVHESESFDAAWVTLLAAFTVIGMCTTVLSDNAKAYLKLESSLAQLGINKIESSPFHPQTCGKVERFHQTQANWLAARPPAHTIQELQSLVDEFRRIYNYQRPHRANSRRSTPADRWAEMPKAGPRDRPLDLDTPTTTHRTKVAVNGLVHIGKTYSISLGAVHAGQTADTVITGTRADVFINGNHIRNLVLDPTRRVQPLNPKPGRPRKTPKP